MRYKLMFSMTIAATVIAGCATAPAPPVDTAPPDTASRTAGLPAALRNEIAMHALAQIGRPYAFGGMSPETGFDCSGLVAFVYRRATLDLPRDTYALARIGQPIDVRALEPGDLLFFNTQRRANSHVGIYLGEARFVHAPTTGGTVRIEDMRLAYWTQRFDGARRVTP